MGILRKTKLRKAKPYLLAAIFVVVFVVVFLLFMLPGHIVKYYERSWNIYYEERGGTEYRIEERMVNEVDTVTYMKAITTRQYLDVFIDGENIFSYKGGEDGLPGRGIYPMKIPESYIGKTIRLEMSSPYPNDNHMMGSLTSVEGYGLNPYDIDYYSGIVSLVAGVSITIIAMMLVIAGIARLNVWMLAAAVLFFAGFVLSNTRRSMEMTDPQAMYYLYYISFLLYPICMFIYLFISYSEGLKKALFPFLMMPVVFAAVNLATDIAGVATVGQYDFWYTYVCLVCGVVMLTGNAFSPRADRGYSKMARAILIGWACWGFSMILRSRLQYPFTVQLEYIVVYTATCVVQVLYSLAHYTKQLIGMQYKELYLTEKNKHLARYYKNIEGHIHDVALLKHEMKHHLTTLNYLYRDGKIDEAGKYLEQFGASYEKLDDVRICDNHIVNAILGYLKGEAGKLGIKLEIVCNVPAELFLRDEELSSLLLNLVENALESCARADAAGRRISMLMRYENSLLLLHMENSVAEVKKKGGRFVTTKKDTLQHGYGLEVVDKIAMRYDGTVETRAGSGMFVVEVLLNAPRDGEEG